MDRAALFKIELGILCLILLLAAWLRFSHLDQAEFLWDQAEISRWGLRVAQEHKIPWIGPISSTGVDTFPVAIWLYAIPYTFSSSPVFATGFVALLNLLTVVGCYFLTRRWFGRTAGLVATLLYAVAPWAVIYSRKIWHTVLMPPLLMLYVTTGWLAFVRGRRWALVVHALVLATLVQTHLTSLPFILLTVLWGVIFCRRIDWRIVPLGALAAGLTFVPWLIADAQMGWKNVQRYAELARLPATVDADALRATWVVTTGYDLQHLTSIDRHAEFLTAMPNARWLFAVLGGLVIIGLGVALWQSVRRGICRGIRRDSRGARVGLDDGTASVLMTATWLMVPALFLTRHSTMVAPHYFTITFPAQFILVGWLIAQVGRLKGHLGRVGQGLLLVLVVAIAVAQVHEGTSVLRFVMTRETAFGGYGTPITYELQAVETAKRLAQGIDGQEVIVLSLGDEPRMYEMPNAADVLLYDMPHRSVDIRSALVFPSKPAVYWATYEMTPGEELLATFTPELTGERIPLREGIRFYRFYRWPGGQPAISCLQPLSDGPRTWANGARLIGVCLEGSLRPGEAIHWMLVWQPTRTPTEDVYYHWFNHLVDGQGELRAQQDGPSLLPAYWRVDDTVLNWFDLQIPPDAPVDDYTLRVGMYTYPALENVPVQSTDGLSVQPWIEVGPFQMEKTTSQ